MGELLSASAVGILASEGKRDCAGKTCADDSNFDVSAHSCHRIAMMDGHRSNFATRQDTISLPAAPSPAHHQEAAGKTSERVSAAAQAGQASREVTLRPYPYFFYRDFSGVPDPDPLTPLTGTPSGFVPSHQCNHYTTTKSICTHDLAVSIGLIVLMDILKPLDESLTSQPRCIPS